MKLKSVFIVYLLSVAASTMYASGDHGETVRPLTLTPYEVKPLPPVYSLDTKNSSSIVPMATSMPVVSNGKQEEDLEVFDCCDGSNTFYCIRHCGEGRSFQSSFLKLFDCCKGSEYPWCWRHCNCCACENPAKEIVSAVETKEKIQENKGDCYCYACYFCPPCCVNSECCCDDSKDTSKVSRCSSIVSWVLCCLGCCKASLSHSHHHH